MFQFQCFCLKSSHNAIPRYPDGVGSFSDTHIFISDVSNPALHRVHTIVPACRKTSSRTWFGENWLIGHWLINTSLHQIEYLSRSRRRQCSDMQSKCRNKGAQTICIEFQHLSTIFLIAFLKYLNVFLNYISVWSNLCWMVSTFAHSNHQTSVNMLLNGRCSCPVDRLHISPSHPTPRISVSVSWLVCHWN